jgi:hypothetical protein
VVIDTEYTGSCKSNYNTITTTTVPSPQDKCLYTRPNPLQSVDLLWENLTEHYLFSVYFHEFQNFKETVKTLVAFLKLSEKDDSFYDDLERACNFQNMKQNKPDDTVSFDSLGRSLLYRKGEFYRYRSSWTEGFKNQLDTLPGYQLGVQTM